MSEERKLAYGSVSDIFNKEIKGKIDAPWRFQRQLERCAVLMAGADPDAFEASVRGLLGDCPLHIKNIIMGRQGEFNITPSPTYAFMSTCGVNIGTPNNPFISVEGHPEWEFLNDIPRSLREEYEDRITRISPREKPGVLYTDHEKLLEIIKEQAEIGGIGWRYDRVAKEMGPVEKVLPGRLASEIEKMLVEKMTEHRRKGHFYSWAELIGSQQHRTPRTPTPPKEGKE